MIEYWIHVIYIMLIWLVNRKNFLLLIFFRLQLLVMMMVGGVVATFTTSDRVKLIRVFSPR
jgi:hypothetical protein